MRVLHATEVYLPSLGGQEVWVRSLVQNLAAQGVAGEVLALDRSIYDPRVRYAPREVVDGITVTRVPWYGIRQYPVSPVSRALLEGFDLIHVHGTQFFLNWFALTRPLHRKPIVLNTMGALLHTRRRAWLKQVYLHTATRASLAAVDRVLAEGENMRALFAPLTRRLSVIELGVDAAPLLALPRRPRRGHVVTVSRLSPHKRVDLIIDSVARLAPRFPELALSVVGPDTHGLRASLEERARARGVADRVHFLGPLPDEAVRELMSTAQVFVCASEMESWGLVACEAMAAGVPALLSPLPTFRRMAETGEGILVTDYSDPERVDRDLSMLLEESEADQARRSAAGRAGVRAFSMDDVARRVGEVYRDVLAR